MKPLAAARLAQGYTKRTPVRCETCARRVGGKCGLGGFQVALWGACKAWTDSVQNGGEIFDGNRVLPVAKLFARE